MVGGEIQGNLKISGHLILQSTAKVLGDIVCTVFRVEDGAQFSGKCVMGGNGVSGGSGKKTPVEKAEPLIEPEE